MIICADDFGLADDINEAISQLARAGRVSATSIMVTAPCCTPLAISRILEVFPPIALGLHLAFTEVPFLLPGSRIPSLVRLIPSYRSLVWRSLAGRLVSKEALDEIRAQYNRFTDLVGRAPEFIDGHHHAHQLPGIREGLLSFLTQLPGNQRPYVRNTYVPIVKNLTQGVSVSKTIILSLLGKRLRRRLIDLGIQTNDEFTGVYAFNKTGRYPQFLARFVKGLRSQNAILMVHPGFKEAWRRMEFNCLQAMAPLSLRRSRTALNSSLTKEVA
jgi:hypothetical protein